jgi:hypothetical protein
MERWGWFFFEKESIYLLADRLFQVLDEGGYCSENDFDKN